MEGKRLAEEDESTAAPNKKLALDESSVPVAASPSTAGPLIIDDVFVEKYQKEAIWREMLIYKERLAQAESGREALKSAQMDLEKQSLALGRWWGNVEQGFLGVEALLTDASTLKDEQITSSPSSSEIVQALLSAATANSNDNFVLEKRLKKTLGIVESAMKNISAAVESRRQQIEKITGILEQQQQGIEGQEELQALIKDLQESRQSLEANYVKLQANHQAVSDKLAESELYCRSQSSKIKELEGRLLESEQSLVHLQRRVQREKSVYGRAVEESVDNIMPLTTEHNEQRQQPVESSPATGNNTSGDNPSTDLQALKTLQSELDDLREQMESSTSIADSRGKEIDWLRTELLKTKQQLDQAIVDLQSLPDARITETGVYRQLKRQMEFCRAEGELEKSKNETLTKELNNLNASRREFLSQLQTQEAEKRKQLEGELKKLMADLNRIRSARDTLQQQLEAEKAKHKRHDEANIDLRLNANENKERIKCLLEEIKRMKHRMAAFSGDERLFKDVLFACELENTTSGDSSEQQQLPKHKSLVESLQDRLEKAEASVRHLKSQLDSTGKASSEEEQRRLNDSLKAKLERYEQICGALDNFSQSEDKQREIDALKLKIQSYQLAEESTVNEIEMISKSFTKLESRQTQQMNLMAEKEDQIAKLLAERIKHEQKLAAMQRERDSHSNKAIALGRQSQKQMEMIKKAEEDLQAKESTLIALEREIAQYKSLIGVHEKKAQDALELAEELSLKIEKSFSKYTEISSIIHQRDEEIGQCQSRLQSLDEENRKLQTKVKHLTRKLQSSSAAASGEDGGSADLLETLKDWKKIAQCSVCEFRIKNTVLTRCMHVFCKECIDARLETRQRKCPQCGIMFGPGEVKQIFI